MQVNAVSASIPSNVSGLATGASSRLLQGALLLSVALHAVALSIHFTQPERKPAVRDTGLEVVLVNTRTLSAPETPQALAQATLDGGGQAEGGMRSSPLPASTEVSDGELSEAAQQQLAELEAQQNQLLALLNQNQTALLDRVAPLDATTPPIELRPTEAQSQLELLQRQMAAIDDRISDYQLRPRRHFFAPSTSEYRYAQYVEEWRRHIETVGNQNYPAEARGRLYGALKLTVFVRADGSVEAVEIDQSSGHPILDQAALRIVRLATPFAPFPSNIARDTDILAITRTWHFTRDALEARAR